MGLLTKDEQLTVDDVLKGSMVVGFVSGGAGLAAISAGLYAAKKTIECTARACKRERRSKPKRVRRPKVRRQTKRTKQLKRPRQSTKRELAIRAKKQLEEKYQIIDEMVMDSHEKEIVKDNMYSEYLWKIRNIVR